MTSTPVTWSSSDDYAPFDQKKHLGDPPWSGPELAQWEEAHGHDVRLKCYPEHGCMAVEYAYNRLWDAANEFAYTRHYQLDDDEIVQLRVTGEQMKALMDALDEAPR